MDGEVRNIFILRFLKLKWVFIFALFGSLIFYQYSQRSFDFDGTFSFASDYSTGYGVYNTGYTLGSEFAAILKGEEFAQRLIDENDWSLSTSDVSAMYDFEFLDSNQFILSVDSKDRTKARQIYDYIQNQSSSFLTYVIQKRALDTFVFNFNSALISTQNQSNYNEGLISAYKIQLEGIDQFLIQQANFAVVNPSYTYVESKILDLEFAQRQLSPTLTHYQNVVTDLTALQQIMTSYEGYTGSDHRFDPQIQIASTFTSDQSIIDNRLPRVLSVLLGFSISFGMGLYFRKVFDTYVFSKSGYALLKKNFNLIRLDLKDFGNSYKIIIPHIVLFGGSLFKMIERRAKEDLK